MRAYASREAVAVRPLLIGDRVLDLGAGEGYVAAGLADAATVYSVDVGAFRRAHGSYVVYDGTRLPFDDGAFGTTMLLLVLHHCADAAHVLDEAIRVTSARIIVIESAVRTRLDRFWLETLDGRLNAGRHDGAMPPALDFRSPEGWRDLFASRGLRVVEERWLGGWWERLVHHPVLFALEPGATRGPARVAV